MTTDQITLLEAGLECDRLIQQVLGWSEQGIREIGSAVRPSTDWNDAMYAAERFGLFVSRGMILGHDGEQWVVTEDAEPIAPEFPGTKAPTGPLAICRAILKLHSRGERTFPGAVQWVT